IPGSAGDVAAPEEVVDRAGDDQVDGVGIVGKGVGRPAARGGVERQVGEGADKAAAVGDQRDRAIGDAASDVGDVDLDGSGAAAGKRQVATDDDLVLG